MQPLEHTTLIFLVYLVLGALTLDHTLYSPRIIFLGQKYPNECTCLYNYQHHRRKRIVDGELVAGEEKYPWTAALKNEEGKIFCSGTIISTKYILTAYHCTMSLDKTGPNRNCVLLGDGKFVCSLFPGEIFVAPHIEVSIEEPVLALPVALIHRHPLLNPQTFAYDLAILQMAQLLPCITRSLPACLPVAPVAPGTMVDIAGYGSAERGEGYRFLRLSRMKVTDLGTCSQAAFFAESKICSHAPSGSNVCWGDSGSGMVTVNGNMHTVVGVLSTTDCARSGIATCIDVFQNIYWINSIVEEVVPT